MALCVCREVAGRDPCLGVVQPVPSGSRNGPESKVTTMLIRVSDNGKVEGEGWRWRAVPYYSSETSKLSLGPIFPPHNSRRLQNSPPIAFRFLDWPLCGEREILRVDFLNCSECCALEMV